ncbi:MAG: hypothetical protein GY711_23365 [bacterium]|nr:hypothetical protein [bacterium]
MSWTIALALAAFAGEDVRYVDATIELEEDLLAWRFVDVTGDGKDELCLAVGGTSGREVRVHEVAPHRIATEPRYVVPVLDDVLAFTFADVRAEEGRELVFLTRTGAWSYSPTLEGYRGNIARLVESDLLYDVPDPRALPYWKYVLHGDTDGGFEHLLLPDRRSFSIWSPAPDADGADGPSTYVRKSSYAETVGAFQPARDPDGRTDGSDEERDDDGPLIEVDGPVDGKVLLREDESGSDLLASGRSFSAPAVLDVDGDGRDDMLRRRGKKIFVYIGTAAGLPAEPTRVEKFPEYLRRDSERLDLRVIDLDGDGDVDLLARWTQDSDGLENSKVTLQMLENDGTRLLPEKPIQLMRFEAAILRTEVTDVDQDGAPDLVVRKFEMPGLMDTVTGLEFKSTHLLFPGDPGNGLQFARRPALKQVETFDEETFLGVVANRSLRLDCDGDGIADLVEIDVRGRVAIRRLAKRSSRLRGDSWSLEEDPWKRFEVRGDISSLAVRDLNGDGLGDVVSRGENSLTVLLSAGGRGR